MTHDVLPDHVESNAELRCDVAVIGSGIAGLVTALDLLELRPDVSVVLVDKGAVGTSGSTPLAQGGLAAAVGPDDSPELHAADTNRAGDGHTDPRAVSIVAHETPDRVADLERRGANFDRDESGELELAREGGQTVGRSVRAADYTGAEIFRALRESAVTAAEHSGRLGRVQGMAVSLATADLPHEPVTGVWLLLDNIDGGDTTPSQAGGLTFLRAKSVVLASGGCGGLFAATTNRAGATGDAIAMAGQAGAALQDLEFIQFHPTGLKSTKSDSFQRFLLTEALRGAGAYLIDANGERFMPAIHSDAELAPRHIVAKAILDQPGGVWLDATMIPTEQMRDEFPTVLDGAATYGVDLLSEPAPVEPCEHYMIGGVATDLCGRTTVPNLYSAGESANSGVHGANRMAGNSLAQSCVFAHRVAVDIARSLPEKHLPGDPTPPHTGSPRRGTGVATLRTELRRVMSQGAGAIRDRDGLIDVRTRLDDMATTLHMAWGSPYPPLTQESMEVSNMIIAARAIVSSALRRTESRGAHFRTDYPSPDPGWAGRRQRMRINAPLLG